MKANSIKKSILVITSTGMLILAIVLIGLQAINEVNNSRSNTQRLVTEQISLIVNHLDTFRMIQQVEFITKTIFDLDEVEAVALYDKDCGLVNRQPLNFQASWSCQVSASAKNIVAYEIKNSWADSIGAPHYIFVKLRDNYSFFNFSNILGLIVVLVAIGATLYFLLFLIREKIIAPLNSLKNIICAQGELSWAPNDKNDLPIELRPIYDSVFRRDQILKSAKEELLKQKEATAMADLSKQVAHDIRSPLMILRDKLLKTEWQNDPNSAIYSSALRDLENLSDQLLKNTGSYVGVHDLKEIVENVLEMKKVEFSNSIMPININFICSDDDVQIKVNKVKFRAVLSNIINNAHDASLGWKPCEIKIKINKDDQFALIYIADNGIGIENSLLDKLFAKGTSYNKPGGSGLGLYNARNDMRDVGGDVFISSKVKIGTQVLIKIPLAENEYQYCGNAPFDYIFVEDYKLSQLIWLSEARQRKLNFVVFSDPAQFESNVELIKKDATIYVDSRFSSSKIRGEVWSRSIAELGFRNIYLCSSEKIDIADKPWIIGVAAKEKPFFVTEKKLYANEKMEIV